ncbi:uncharacterized protein LOC135471646 [Liolophura sinensis]|uniref:uncharacterized protein LOC135471646 n=1 Tax=Liolophura sinensis TaxID=3198878 RepID=UPI003159608E
MDSTEADDRPPADHASDQPESDPSPTDEHKTVNGHSKRHSRQNSIGCNNSDLEASEKDKTVTEKSPTGAYEKLKGLFRSKSSAGSKSNSGSQIKISMHPEGPEDKKMSQKSSSRSTKLTLDSHEADGESDTDFEIPNDGNLYTYSVDNMMQFFKYMNFDDKIIKSLQRRKVDGRRFSKMTDDDLKKYGIDNPVVMYFRQKSEKKREMANMFML